MIKSIKKNSQIICYTLAFIIPVIFMLIICNALNMSPFAWRNPLVADTSVQFEIYYAYLKSVFFGNNDLLYTFSKTIGGDMAGFSFYYIGNPFAYLLIFLPNAWMPAGVLFIIILLMALSSLNFNIMVNNIFGFRWSSLLFSISYAFMGFFMAYYNFIIYFNNIMLFPIIILGLYEITVKDKISFKYILFLSISIITNYYIGYMTCIFCGLFFIYLIVINKKGVTTVKAHLLRITTFTWETLLSVMISSVALLTVVNSLKSGQKINDSFGLKISRGINFRLTDVFTGLYTSSFNGNISDGLPIIYCGVLGVVFAILYFLNKEIKLKEKIASGVLILIFIASFYFKFINRIWHGMAETVGFPYRYSFMLSFFFLFIGYQAFILMKQGTRKFHTLIIFGIFVIYSLYLLITRSPYVGKAQILLTGTFLVMILAGVYAICYKREYMYPITIGFLTIISFDLLINGYHSIRKYYPAEDFREDLTVDYYDNTYNSLKDIHDFVESDHNSNEFYRMDKLYRESHNDAMLVGYNGLSHFSSTESSKVLDFMKKVGFCSNNMWSYYGEDGNTAFTDSFFSLKYLISQYDETSKPYDLINEINDKYVFKNPYPLSLAMPATEEVTELDLDKYNEFTIQNELAKCITGNTYGIYRPVEVINTNLENVEKYEKTYTIIDPSKDAYIEYELNITSDDFIYMYFDAPQRQDTRIEVNGLEKTDYFNTYGWSIKGTGHFDENDIVPVRIYLEQDEIEVDRYEFYYESKEELKRFYEDAIQDKIKVQELSSSHLLIDADTNKERIILSMPYDKGWKVYIDGEETETDTEEIFDCLLSFKIKPGKHVIEMKYIPQGLIPGAIISICGIVILITLYIIERKRINKLLRGE